MGKDFPGQALKEDMDERDKPATSTIRDVARHAGVAPGTVSRVLNNRMGRMTVTPETRERILESARVLNYMPNIHARRLFSRRAGEIALVLPEAIRATESRLDMHIFGIICGIEEELSQEDCHLLLITDNERFRRRGDYLAHFHENAVDGMLVWGAMPQAGYWQEVEEQHFPLIFLGTSPAGCSGIPLFSHDYFSACRKLTERLLAAGHRRFLRLGGRLTSDIARAGHDGVLAALAECPEAKLTTVWSDYSTLAAMEEFRRHCAESAGDFTAVLAGNLRIARAVRLHWQESDPGQSEGLVAVALDGSEFEENDAMIDTVVVHDSELGRQAARALLKYIETRRKPGGILLPVDFFECPARPGGAEGGKQCFF